MKYARILVFVLCTISPFTTTAQRTMVEHQFEQLQGPTPMSWVTQRFLIQKEFPTLQLAGGLETQSAVFGNYGGFYVFGLHARAEKNFKAWNTYAGLSVATGGGAGAPDGDGLMYRLEAGIGRSLSSSSRLFITYSTLDFPSGTIYSHHPGVNFSYSMPYEWQPSGGTVALFPGAVSIIGGVFLFDALDATRISERGNSLYTGVRFTQELQENLELDLQLGASAVGSTDGFMDYKAGFTKVFGSGPYNAFIRGQLGSGGGGSVETGGGISTAVGAGVRLFDRIEISYNYWDALQTSMQAPLLEVSYRVPFQTNFGFVSTPSAQWTPKEELATVDLPLIIGSRWNLKEGIDRNGLPYQPMGSIFLGTKLRVAQNFWVSGETLWAATGGYGAYAEGMFGIYQDLVHKGQHILGWNASLVAAGGGGIETNKGLAAAVGAQYSLQGAGKNRWTVLARKKYFGPGAYNPWVIGVQYEPTFAVFSR